MAPTKTQEEGGEASRSRRSRARRHNPAPPTVVTRSRSDQSEPAKRTGTEAAKEQSKKTKRSSADKSRSSATATKKRSMGDQEAAVSSPSAAADSEATSAVSSPLRWPYIPDAVKGHDSSNIDPAIVDACDQMEAKYFEKLAREVKLVTLDPLVPHSCLIDPKFRSIRESATKTCLEVARVVFGLSSQIDGKLLARCSGFLISWNKEKKVGTILTSALLFRSKSPSLDEWLGTDEFSPDAEVHAHLLDKDDTTVVARLLRYEKHYNLALFEIDIDLSARIPSLSSELKFGQEVFVLGRDESLHLIIDYSSVQHKGPSRFEHHHYMFTSCGLTECGIGGPVIDFNGQFVGMINLPEMAFIPSSIILKCLHMLKKFNCAPRLHVGMKFSEIKFLDPTHVEKIYRKCNIDGGLIVKQVSVGSFAEKLGVKPGDVIECWNGERISTTIELENMLLRMSEEHLDKGHGINSSVDVLVGIFHTRKGSRRTITLTLNVCDAVEVFPTGEYAINATHCAMVSDGDVGSGQETPRGTGEDEAGDN